MCGKEELLFVSVLKRLSTTSLKISGSKASSGRKTSGLLFKINGTSEYVFSNKSIAVNRGEIIYIPQGAKYLKKLITTGDSLFMSLNFKGVLLGNEPILFTDFNREYITERFNQLYNLQTQTNSISQRLKCESIMYDILSALTESNAHGRVKYLIGRIKPSFDYIHNNMFNPELEIDSLGEKSGVSNAYFRAIFKEITGKSPKKYVSDRRMEYAKNAIDNGELSKIGELSAACGYTDSLYFGKVFKSYYGISPKKYEEKLKKKFLIPN